MFIWIKDIVMRFSTSFCVAQKNLPVRAFHMSNSTCHLSLAKSGGGGVEDGDPKHRAPVNIESRNVQ